MSTLASVRAAWWISSSIPRTAELTPTITTGLSISSLSSESAHFKGLGTLEGRKLNQEPTRKSMRTNADFAVRADESQQGMADYSCIVREFTSSNHSLEHVARFCHPPAV